MRAEIICVGTELLLGDIADTNTQYLAQRLSALGIDLFYSTAVGDNMPRLVDTLRRAIGRSDLVITSGGLGPTDDDITRESIAEVFGETPVVDPKLVEELRHFFALRRLEMTQNNLKQASLIPSARSVRNVRGTAPGWWVENNGHTVIAMPGPPGELHNMWETEVEPALQRTGSVIASRTLKMFNISESRVDELLKPLTPSSNPTVGVYAKQDGIHVRITAKAPDSESAREAIAAVEAEARALLGDAVWGVDNETQEGATAAALMAKGLTLAVAESSTGGHLTYMLTGVGDSDRFFKGSIVVPDVPADPARVADLARRAAEQFGADIGVATGAAPTPDADPPMIDVFIAAVRPAAGTIAPSLHRSRPFRARLLSSYYALHDLRRFLASQ
jgi:nicotinamide-nucleotide amidase